MIVTLTLNPSIDYVMNCPEILPGETNRSGEEQIYPGGKGINVSIMLKRLGIESRCIAVKAGETGDLLEKLLIAQGLFPQMIPLEGEGFTRINVKLCGGSLTEINAKGPVLSPGTIEKVCRELEKMEQNDILVLAGRFPQGGEEIFPLLARLREKRIRIAADCSGPVMARLMEAGPFLAKPNLSELEELTGVSLKDWESITKAVRRFWKPGNREGSGAEHILLSMGERGAALFWDTENVWFSDAPAGKAVNPVGAGDSMLAGCLGAFLDEKRPEEILRLAVACGSGTAFSPWIAQKPLPLESLVLKQLVWQNTGERE